MYRRLGREESMELKTKEASDESCVTIVRVEAMVPGVVTQKILSAWEI